MHEDSERVSIRITTIAHTLQGARRLVALAESASTDGPHPTDRDLLLGGAVLFLQIVLEHGLALLSLELLPDAKRKSFDKLPIRDRLKRLDELTGGRFYAGQEHVDSQYWLDRLVTFRNRLAHAENADIRLTATVDDDGKLADVRDERGRPLGNDPLSHSVRGLWFVQLSAEDVRKQEQAVVAFLEFINPNLFRSE